MRRKPEPGMTRCLGGCDKTFLSRDRATNRVCPRCAKRRGRDVGPRVYSTGGHDGKPPPSLPE